MAIPVLSWEIFLALQKKLIIMYQCNSVNIGQFLHCYIVTLNDLFQIFCNGFVRRFCGTYERINQLTVFIDQEFGEVP